MLRHIACVSGLLAAGLLIGCGSGVKPEVVPPLEPVSGKVMLDGQPAQGVSVTFFPAPGTNGNPCTASTDSEGKYKLMHRSGKEGVPVGDYIVLFSKMTQPDGSPIPPDKTAADVNAVEQIPEQYRSMENLANGRAVAKGGGTFDFDLKTK